MPSRIAIVVAACLCLSGRAGAQGVAASPPWMPQQQPSEPGYASTHADYRDAVLVRRVSLGVFLVSYAAMAVLSAASSDQADRVLGLMPVIGPFTRLVRHGSAPEVPFVFVSGFLQAGGLLGFLAARNEIAQSQQDVAPPE